MNGYNREALAIEIDLNIAAQRAVWAQNRIVATRVYPMKMRIDNGSELITLTLAQWAEEHDKLLEFIKLGKST